MKLFQNISKNISLQTRLTIFIIFIETILIISFALSNYFHTKKEILKEFNDSIKDNAQYLATLVIAPENINENAFEINFIDEFMPQFSKNNKPEVFAYFNEKGEILKKSKSLEKVPSFIKPISKSPCIFDFSFKNAKYRGVIIKTKRKTRRLNETTLNFFVFYGKSIEGILHEIEENGYYFMYISLILIAISVIIIPLLIKTGLKPLNNLLNDVKSISIDNLNYRISHKNYQKDLIPVVSAFNMLLSKATEALNRERQFSEDAAHELRTPVTILKSSIQTEMLCQHSDKTIKFLESLLNDINRIDKLCEGLLCTAKVVNSNQNEKISYEDWYQEVENTVLTLQKTAPLKNFSIKSIKEQLP